MDYREIPFTELEISKLRNGISTVSDLLQYVSIMINEAEKPPISMKRFAFLVSDAAELIYLLHSKTFQAHREFITNK